MVGIVLVFGMVGSLFVGVVGVVVVGVDIRFRFWLVVGWVL